MMFGLLINLRLSSTLAGFKFSVNNGYVGLVIWISIIISCILSSMLISYV